jgi:hypothetical protein
LASAHLVLFQVDPLSQLGDEAREHPFGDLRTRDI